MERDAASRDVAKVRLRQVLVHDRASLSPERMTALKNALILTAGEYVNVDTSEVTLHLELKEDCSSLIMRMPILSIVRERET